MDTLPGFTSSLDSRCKPLWLLRSCIFPISSVSSKWYSQVEVASSSQRPESFGIYINFCELTPKKTSQFSCSQKAGILAVTFLLRFSHSSETVFSPGRSLWWVSSCTRCPYAVPAQSSHPSMALISSSVTESSAVVYILLTRSLKLVHTLFIIKAHDSGYITLLQLNFHHRHYYYCMCMSVYVSVWLCICVCIYRIQG